MSGDQPVGDPNNKPDALGPRPLDSLSMSGFDPSQHSPTDVMKFFRESDLSADESFYFLDNQSEEACRKVLTNQDYEQDLAVLQQSALDAFVDSEPDPETDELFFWALAPMAIRATDAGSTDEIADTLEDLLVLTHGPERQELAGLDLRQALAGERAKPEEPAETIEPKQKKHANPFLNPPEGFEPLFSHVAVKGRRDKDIVISRDFLEASPRRKQAAHDLKNALFMGSTHNPAIIYRKQQALTVVLGGFPREVKDFILSDPKLEAPDQLGWKLVANRYGLYDEDDGKITITDPSNLGEESSKTNKVSINNRLRRLVDMFVWN